MRRKLVKRVFEHIEGAEMSPPVGAHKLRDIICRVLRTQD